MPKDKTFSFRVTEKQYKGLLEKAGSQERSVGDVIREAIDDYLEPKVSDNLRQKQIELFDRLAGSQDTMVEKLGKMVELLTAISKSFPRKETQDD
jgi:hypothetical protein